MNERFPGGFDDLAGYGAQLVDLEHALYLGEETLNEAEVPAGDARDCCDGFSVSEVFGGEVEAELVPVVGEHEAQLVGAERPVVVGKPDAAVELGVAGEAFLEAGACR